MATNMAGEHLADQVAPFPCFVTMGDNRWTWQADRWSVNLAIHGVLKVSTRLAQVLGYVLYKYAKVARAKSGQKSKFWMVMV